MLMNYKEAIEQYGNDYKLNKAVESKELYKIENGIYSPKQYENELGIIMKKYPKAVLTGEYAFFMYDLTDVIPEKYDLATSSKAAKIKDCRVNQIYMKDELLNLGVVERKVDGCLIRIYDRERMLVELLRHKNTMPYDLYKEVLLKYREIINNLEIWRIQEYADIFPKSKMIKKAIDEEVL